VRSQLARVRVDKGIGRPELAQATGISYNSLYRLESGLVKNPPLWWYLNCAIALGVKIEDILDYAHSGWHGTLRAPTPPDPSWLKAKAQGKAQKKPAPPQAAKPSKGTSVRHQRLRKSGLAEGG
jgi:DNA-binding Xre family transcriptional regulator